MDDNRSANDTIREFFAGLVHATLGDKMGLPTDESVELYLADMLARFIHDDRIFAIKDAAGMRVESVAEMLVEGDVRLRADSFDREREVHRHIGDFVLFWSGLFPEFLGRVEAREPAGVVDLERQGKESYYIVSTFDHGRYADQAPTFRRLSRDFEAYQIGLRVLRAQMPGLGPKKHDG